MTDSLLKYTGGLINKAALSAEDRIVAGIYTSDTVDLHGHIIDKNAMLAALEDYRQWGTIREQHDRAVGNAKSIGFPAWNNIEAYVSKSRRGDEVLQLVNEGVYKAFSVGLLVTNGEFVPFTQLKPEDLVGLPYNMVEMFREIGDVFKITGITLVEVSIVDRPANPLARVQSVQNEFGVQVSGVLPSLSQKSAIDVIKGVIAKSGGYIHVTEEMHKQVHADSTASNVVDEIVNESEVIVGDTENKEVDNVEAVDVVDAVVTDEADAKIENTEVQDNQEVVVVEEKAVDGEQPEADVFADAVKALTEMAQSINETAKSLTTLVNVGELAKEISAAIVAELRNTVNETVEDVEKNIVLTDAQVKSIAEQVAAVVPEYRISRKGAVNQTAPVVDDEINVKSLNRDQLGNYIAKMAAANIR